MRNLPKARVARLAGCHKKQKAGYCQDASPKLTHSDALNNKTLAVNDIRSETSNRTLSVNSIKSKALEYWQDELATKEEATRVIYLKNFKEFLQYSEKIADRQIEQRRENLTDKDLRIQRTKAIKGDKR
jgi:hypothetical protein